jgi:uncharacterized protein with HEPN domain
MSRDAAYLLDMLESSRLALSHLGNVSQQRFFDDLEQQDAVIRRLLVIGEAARKVSEETRREMPELPWTKMIAMRNLLVHEYDDVDLTIVWDTVRNGLPGLIAKLETVVPEQP